MAGRAGRRGIDEKGYVYTLVDLSRFRPEDFPKMDEKAVEPLTSRFAISYNSVLNMLTNYPPQEIEGLLARSFANFQRGARTDELTASLARIEGERAELVNARCVSYGRDECPLVVERLKLELRRERYRGKRAKTATKERASEEKIAGIRVKLATVKPRSCPRVETRKCKAVHKRLKRLDEVAALLSQETTRSSEQGYLADFWRRRDILEALGYVDPSGVQGRGRVASQIHVQELLVTELIFDGAFERLTEDEVSALAVSIDYEQRSRGNGWWLRKTQAPFDEQPVLSAVRRITRIENRHLAQTSTRYATQLAQAAFLWSQGAAFTEVVRQSGTDPGDIVHAFRRAIDLLRQVKGAVRQDEAMVEKLNRCIARLDRDVVAVEL
jgi:superfamily II RNA helicase